MAWKEEPALRASIDAAIGMRAAFAQADGSLKAAIDRFGEEAVRTGRMQPACWQLCGMAIAAHEVVVNSLEIARALVESMLAEGGGYPSGPIVVVPHKPSDPEHN